MLRFLIIVIICFRLGRNPIHFHLLGNMIGSYVRGCSIHQSFNRAINIHGTKNVLIENTVIFDIMGGAFFHEDGIETGNIWQYNLAIFVRMSSSLQNDDIAPAAFWVTNPNNTIRHNHVAGGTHFGFLYRISVYPKGQSFNPNVCMQYTELGIFFNNTVHSQGLFGLQVIEKYTPQLGSGCRPTIPAPAVYDNIFVYNCKKGVEFFNVGSVQLNNSYLVNNQKVGAEWKLITSDSYNDGDNDNNPGLYNSLIIGRTNSLTENQQGCTDRGVIAPYGEGFVVDTVRFVNFDVHGCCGIGWTRIHGICSDNCGGYQFITKGLKWINAYNRVYFEWTFQGHIKDRDGTILNNKPNQTIITCTGTLPSTCTEHSYLSVGYVAGCICPNDLKFHRFAFNNVKPESLLNKKIRLSNSNGNTTTPFKLKSVSHDRGWHTVIIGKEENLLEFVGAGQITNISYTGVHYNIGPVSGGENALLARSISLTNIT